LTTAFHHEGPSAVRYPRGRGPGLPVDASLVCLPVGKGEVRRRSGQPAGSRARVALLAFGSLLTPALEAAEVLDATVANMRFVKPLDGELLRELAQDHGLFVTLEENSVIGGAGSEVARFLEQAGIAVPVVRLGLPDRFVDHGDSGVLLAQLGLDAEGIVTRCRAAQ